MRELSVHLSSERSELTLEIAVVRPSVYYLDSVLRSLVNNPGQYKAMEEIWP